MAAEAIGAFLAGFTDQYLELKREQRQADQFQQSLQIHEMALKLQQLRHDQSLALQERQQTNLEAHQREQERVDRFQALSGAANVQSQIEQRQAGQGFKEQELQYRAMMGKLSNQLKPEFTNLQKRIQGLKEEGLDSSAEEARLRSIQETLGEANRFIQQPMVSDQQQGPPQPLTGEDEEAEGPQPLGEETQEGEPEPEGPPMLEGGGGGGMAQAAPMEQPPPGRAPAAPGGVVPAQAQPVPMDSGRGIRPPREIQTETGYATRAQAEARNRQLKDLGIYNKVAVADVDLSAEQRAMNEDKVKNYAAEAITALEYKHEIDNAMAREGINARVTGHGKQSVHVGGHGSFRIGGFLGQNASFGLSDSTTETQAPEVSFEFGEEPGMAAKGLSKAVNAMAIFGALEPAGDRFKQPDVADRIATALLKQDQQVKSVAQPYIIGAQKVIMEARDYVQSVVGKQTKTIERGSFDAVLNPERHKVAAVAESLPPAEEKLATITKGPLPPVGGYPAVVDKKESLDQSLDNFSKALRKTGGGSVAGFVGATPQGTRKVDVSMLQELKGLVKPDLPDGTYSKAAQKKAQEIIDGPLQSRYVTPQMRAEATRILADVAVNKRAYEVPSQAVAEGYKVREPAHATTRPISATEEYLGYREGEGRSGKSRLPHPISDVPKLFIPGHFKGLEGLAKLAGGGGRISAADVKNANKEFSDVKSAKDREARAQTAATKLKSAYKNMTEDEQKTLRDQWAAQRNTWKNQYKISERVLKEIDSFLGATKKK